MPTKVGAAMTDGVVKTSEKASKSPSNKSAADEGKVVQLDSSGQIPTPYYEGGGTNTPRFLAYKGSGYQGYGTSTTAKVTFDTEEHDSDSAYDTSQSRFTVPTGKAGVYLFGFGVTIQDVGSAQQAIVKGYKNGTGGTMISNFTCRNFQSTTTNVAGQGTFVATLAEGDYVEIYVTTPATSGAGGAGLAYQFFYGFKLL